MDGIPFHSGRPSAAKHRDPATIGRTASSSSMDSPSYGGSGSQSLASILNNPLASRSADAWSIWWPSGSSYTSAFPEPPPPIVPATPIPEVTKFDFQHYLSMISESYAKFEDVRNHASKEIADSEIRGQGEALVACLREVPSLFFKEDFALEEGETFRAACPFSPSPLENASLQEKLSHYLDIVEMHLVKEISLRSDSFFEAQGQLQGLNGEIVEACVSIRELKETIRVLTVDLVDSAKQVQELNATRGNLVALQQKLTVILYVSQALSALKLLVNSADCAGALDVIDDLQHLQDSEELTGLHCFRHLRDQLATSINTINSILSAEFMHVATRGVKDVDSVIMLKFRAKAANIANGADYDVKLDDEESSLFRDCLLPLIIGLLRTSSSSDWKNITMVTSQGLNLIGVLGLKAKLPFVLRIYRETLISDMKTSVKSTVAELLPVLVSRPTESDSTITERTIDADGGGLSLASKLRNLSSDSFVQLLTAIFKVVQAHLLRAAEVKRVIEWIMGNLDGCDAADSVAAAVALGAAVAAAAETSQDLDVQPLSSLANSLQRNAANVSSFHGRTNESASPNTTKNFRADVLRENTEAVFAACDAAHGRWAKLLGVRALLHPKLRLQEFLSIYNITQDFITATEKIGGRLGYSIRGTLQSQSKAFVDFQHDSRMAKIKAVLDQETWVLVDIPEEFQAIVDSLSSEFFSNSSSTLMVETGESHIELSDTVSNSVESVLDNSRQGIPASSNQEDSQPNKNGAVRSVCSGDGIVPEHGKSASQKIFYKGVGYHMVNCGLILLKMLSEYIDINKCLPALSSEVVHRVAEFLKLFNTRTCQLVLGAGAMQVSGLKSITSKHLALASQIISFIYVIIPDIRRVLFLKVPESRKGLLLSEIDRVAQDYRVHRDEIHTKLVQIMRERLLINLRKLPQIAETWNSPEDNDPQPSQFARSVTKEVSYLHRILSQILLEVDVQGIFRQVVEIFHSHISEAYSNIEIKTSQAKNRLHRDVQHILDCIRKLPSDNTGAGLPNLGLLDEFLAKNFGTKEGQ